MMVFSTEPKPLSGIASLRAGARRLRRRKKRMKMAAAMSAPAIAHPTPMPAAAPEEMLFELWPLLGIDVELPLGVKDPAELAVGLRLELAFELVVDAWLASLGVVGGVAPADGLDVIVARLIFESPLPEGAAMSVAIPLALMGNTMPLTSLV